jgi:peptide/nickel transport system permease protein
MSSQDQTQDGEIVPEYQEETSFFREMIRSQREIFRGERLGQIGLVILVGFILIGIFAPYIAPYEPQRMLRGAGGSLLQTEAPSLEHPFGTTRFGRDLLSQVIVGTRVALIVGFLAAFISVFIGTSVGLVSGYFGGWIDDVLMRITDIVYGLPFIPFVIVLVVILGDGLLNVIIAISLIQWRSTSRVIRSQILTIKERPYIEAAEAAGVGHLRTMYAHLLPNVLPLVLLYAAFSIGWAVIAEASLAFLGFGAPLRISWGQIIYQAYTANAIQRAWWWAVPAGLAINLFVISVFLVGRTYEKVANPDLQYSE